MLDPVGGQSQPDGPATATAPDNGNCAPFNAVARADGPDWRELVDANHFVQFYESDAFLVDSLCGFLAAGLVSGEPAVVIATEAHRHAVDAELRARGLNPAAAREQGRYVTLDAAGLLARIMVDGSPDPERFAAVAGDVLTRVARPGRRTRAFGEMVALLWADGHHAAAVRLEQLWNDLARSYAFTLYCAYPIRGFDGHVHAESFRDICCHHARVLPAESYTTLPADDDRLRVIAELQQRARSLEAEVTRRQAAQRALAAREMELADFFDNAIEGIHKVGPDGTILWANRAELDLLGYRPGEYIGRNIAEFHADQHAIHDMLARLVRGESLLNYPARLRCKDGSIRHVLVQSNACFDDRGQFAYTRCFTRDVTDLARTEQELRRAKAAAEEANRAKDQFLAVLSHELRTPLNPVLLSVAAMESEPGLPPRLRDDLAMIRRNLALETRLIDDLLDLSRVLNGKMTLHEQDVDVHPLARNVADMVAADARAKRLTLRLDLAATNHTVRGDSARLHQVLWNLLHNAIKFTPEGGDITVRTRNEGQVIRGKGQGKGEESSSLAPCPSPLPPSLIIDVTDTGVGITPATLPHIFDAFDQGDHARNRSYGGLGLGLAISKAVLDLHHGSLTAHSDGPGKGATFTLTLPLHAAAERSAAPAASPSLSPQSSSLGPSSLRILLVDDHADTLKVLRRLLELDGHLVSVASSVADAARAAADHPFDLLVSDIGLPDGTGLDLLRQLRPLQPNLPAIAMTGFGMEQDVRNSHDAGFATHLTKPVDLASLKSAIRKLVPNVSAR